MADSNPGAPRGANAPASAPAAEEAAHRRARGLIAERLADIVTWPATRISPHERQLAGDILITLLRTADIDLRAACARRMAQIVDAPKVVLRFLARDAIEVAQPLLEAAPGFDDSDLVASIGAGTPAHWLALARRRNLSETVTEALIQTGDPAVIEAVLRNAFTKLSGAGVDMVVALSRQHSRLAPSLLTRDEMKPPQGLTLFWWADGDARLHILRRFAVDRAVLLQEVTDLFSLAARENWTDREARVALQFIERRQRSRAAAERSPHGSLEGAVQAMSADGLSRELVVEISHLCGVRPSIGARILADPGGEPIAVLAKAVGLKRDFVQQLWDAMKRPVDPDPKSPHARTFYVFDTLATAKAQTVLRYWNWSLSADTPQPGAKAETSTEFSPARRSAALVLGLKP